jgi:uncharacterized protein YndB with AHSA1/START domain
MKIPAKNKGFTIYHDVSIDVSPSKVFNAVSNPKELIQWWPLKCSGEPCIGSSYRFYFGPEYNWEGKVINVKTDQSFHIKMTKSDEDWDSTSFGFDIEMRPKGSLLHFSHTGWQHCNAHFKTASFCWALLLNGLKQYLEKGIIIPFEQRS